MLQAPAKPAAGSPSSRSSTRGPRHAPSSRCPVVIHLLQTIPARCRLAASHRCHVPPACQQQGRELRVAGAILLCDDCKGGPDAASREAVEAARQRLEEQVAVGGRPDCGGVGIKANSPCQVAAPPPIYPSRTWVEERAVVPHSQAKNALQVYEQMLEEGISPDVGTFVGTLQACSILAVQEVYGFVDGQRIKVKFLDTVKAVHANVWNSCFKSNVIVCSTLVSVYSKCGSIVDAQEVFERLPHRDLVTWNAMLAAYAQQGHAEEALVLYQEMLEQNLSPDVRTFVSVVQACGMLAEKGDLVDGQSSKVTALARAKEIHAETRRKGFDSHVFLGNTILSAYSNCDSMVNAQYVFDGLFQRNVVTWNAIIAANAQKGREGRAFQLYENMLNESVVPNHRTFASMIQACGTLGDREDRIFVDRQWIKANSLEKGKALHFEVWSRGYGSYLFIGNMLVKMYANCGSIVDARKVFDGLSQWNVVTCNAMLAAYAQQGQARKVTELYGHFLEKGVIPEIRTFVTVLQACGMLAEKEEEGTADKQCTKFKYLQQGKAIHLQVSKRGYTSDVFIGSTLISMYSKFGCILDAQQVFDGLSLPNVVSWNAMLGAYAQNGDAERALQLYGQMLEEGVQPNVRSLVHALHACGILLEKEDVVGGHMAKEKVLELGKAIHADAWTKGQLKDIFLGNTLVSMYGKGGNISEAQNVFDGLSEPNVVSWTAMLAAYVKQRQGEKALQLYEQMLGDGVNPNHWTFVSALQACGLMSETGEDVGNGRLIQLKSLQKARAIHAAAWRLGYTSDVFINTTLVLIYTECGSIVDAQEVFDTLYERDVVSWNAMLTTYAQYGQAEQVLQLYEQMLEEGVTPDVRTFVSVLQGCSMVAENDEDLGDDPLTKLKFAERGKVIHAEAWKRGYKSNVYICSTLICMYGKYESIVCAEIVFEELSEQNVVAWNAMLGAQAQQGQADKALQLYNRMLKEGVSPNEVTFVCILQACSNGGSLDICSQIHHELVSAKIAISPLLSSSLIQAYGRCASMVDAQSVFDRLLEPNVVAWTALIAGYAYEGNFRASLELYEEMQHQKIKPDGVTFLSLLSVCSHAGLVDKGLEYFESMSTEHGISPAIEHYVTMVDLLGRAGYFEKLICNQGMVLHTV